MRPPYPYFGGKQKMSHLLVSMLPPHRVYLEPFFGAGAVFFAKPLAQHSVINDIDQSVVNFLQVLRERPEDLAEVCALTPHSRVEFDAADLDAADLVALERARRFWVRVNQSFAKTSGGRTGWSATVARNQSIPATVRNRLNRFAPCAGMLMRASIECCPAVDVVTRLAKTDDTLIYADPPYLGATRVNRPTSAKAKGDYRHDMLDADRHAELAEVLRATPATVILSGYPSDLYEDLYGDWWHQDVHVTVHSSNSTTTSRDGRVERIWSNKDLDALANDVEPPPSQLFEGV